ncbi:MAG: hypothetical protein IH588_03530 [Anaerolineales bacterium]|nr:hypothetical protein [Anaerolineales bacterium]
MKTSTRNGAIAGIVAGIGYFIQSVMGLIKPQTEVFSGSSDYVLEVVFIIALLANIFALMGLHTFAQTRYGKSGATGFWLALAGTFLILVSAAATLAAGKNSLGILFLIGLFLSFLGYVLLGITALRSKVLPTWAGLALALGFPLSVLLNTMGGGILYGLAWLGVGYYLMKQ